MIAGNKGGVGKSLFCLALASALDMSNKLYSVLDGDGRTGDVYGSFVNVCPKGQGDFRGLRPESHDCDLDLPYERMLHQLLRTSTDLVVNTPDGADSILLKWFDVTLTHTEQNNYQFKLIYMMSDRGDGLDMLPEFAKRFPFLYPVRNLYFGCADLFTEFNELYADKFKEVIDFPALRGDEVRLLFSRKTFPFEAINLKTDTSRLEKKISTGHYVLNTLTRARIMNWQKKVNDCIVCALDNDDESNLIKRKWV